VEKKGENVPTHFTKAVLHKIGAGKNREGYKMIELWTYPIYLGGFGESVTKMSSQTPNKKRYAIPVISSMSIFCLGESL